MSLEDIFKKMKERFCPLQKIQTTHQEIMQMKMGPNEDIEDYIKRFEDKSELLDLPDLQKTHTFIRGLRADIREWLTLQQPTEPLAAYDAARLMYSAKKQSAEWEDYPEPNRQAQRKGLGWTQG